jgi:putative ABC transport system permease protein
MLFRILTESFGNQRRGMLLMVVAVAAGVALAAAMLTLAWDIRARVSRELRAFGANIVIEPRLEGLADLSGQRRWLKEEDLPRAKTIFWRHNIVGLAPFLYGQVELSTPGGQGLRVEAIGTWFDHPMAVPGGSFRAGVHTVAPWWELTGAPPGRGSLLVGAALAERLGISPGMRVALDGREFKVSGLLRTGGQEDEAVVLELSELQSLLGLKGLLSRVLVSALTTPMDEFAYKDPASMSRKEYEKWYCTGYVTSIAKQLEEVFRGSRARPLWRVAQAEGRVLQRLSALVWLLTALVLASSILGVAATMAASVLRRQHEIALMKSIGADAVNVAMIFLSEALVIGLLGGLLGWALGYVATDFIARAVFSTQAQMRAVLLPLCLALGVLTTLAGSVVPIRRALRVRPAVVLREAL